MDNKAGKVYLVGAGCGKADLITIRGMEKIRSCDVLIYDDLIDTALLNACPAHAERIYMGKRSGSHSAPQEEINAKIIEKAGEGKTVCRLKGGDPFVFGRGGEEVLALQAAGIPYEEIPGISSAIAIPAAAGIPVTHRKLSRSFHVITAHTADSEDGLPEQLDKLAGLEGTLVFLMGLAQLEKICRHLVEAGMKSDMPAAVLSGGNAPQSVSVRGTLSDITEKVRARNIKPPAVIVIGNVAALDLSPTIPKPLGGVTVGLTGTSSISGKLKPALEELGAKAVCVQHSSVCDLQIDLDLSEVFDGGIKWLVFTSGNGVTRFFALLREQSVDLRRLSACKFAVIGSATGRALAQHGFIADLCPHPYTGDALAEELLQTVRPEEPVYIFRSAQGSPLLYEKLREKLQVRDIHTYTTVSDLPPVPLSELSMPSLDYICFSSAGGVGAYFAGNSAIPASAKCVCIGSMTADALKRRYTGPIILSEEISAEGLVKAILDDHIQKVFD
jgi:uroporphyrinogen III methyltransferase/synthase